MLTWSVSCCSSDIECHVRSAEAMLRPTAASAACSAVWEKRPGASRLPTKWRAGRSGGSACPVNRSISLVTECHKSSCKAMGATLFQRSSIWMCLHNMNRAGCQSCPFTAPETSSCKARVHTTSQLPCNRLSAWQLMPHRVSVHQKPSSNSAADVVPVNFESIATLSQLCSGAFWLRLSTKCLRTYRP